MKKILVAALFAAIASPALAAPQGLYGKTVTVTWTETRSQRQMGETTFKPVGLPFTFQLYLSSEGRPFKRLTSVSSSGRRSGTKEGVGSGANASVSYQGNNTVIATNSSGGLGRRVQVTLDSGFSSCSAQVISGKSGGGVAAVKSVATGNMVEFESVSAGAASCSVQNGNAFAN